MGKEMEKVKAGMRARDQEHTKRMLGMLMSTQGNALLAAVLAGWHEHIKELIKERELNNMKANMRAKGEKGMKRMLGMLMGAQGETLLKSVWFGWHEHTANMKKERESEKFRAEMKEKGAESTRRMLAMLMGSQADALKKGVFVGWREHVLELKQHAKMDKLQQQMKAKGGETSKRMLGMLMGAQSEVLVKAAFAGWVENHNNAKIEKIREANLQNKGKEQERQRGCWECFWVPKNHLS